MAPRFHYSSHKTTHDAIRTKAAQYVRVSTAHQKYSIDNQQQVISEYARIHGLDIVRTYADPAKSGLFLARRIGLQRLIADVEGGHTDFNVILVYDVSRWGRFQDTDESAYYEYICKKAGVSVHYCAELFENTGGLFDNLLKHMKRTMAAEYSRDLSKRISQGHQRLAGLGLHQGGPANYGLRRILLDDKGRPRGELAFGQRKCLSSDRVILAPGSRHEIGVVREIFRLFVEEQEPQRRIAKILNDRGTLTRRGYRWCGESIYLVLTCEKYIGTFIYRRSSYRLGSKRIWQPYSRWIRVPGAIKPIIDVKVFKAAQFRIWNGGRFDRNHLLDCLTATLCVNGYLSASLINKLPHMPVVSTYIREFGDLSTAYGLIGYKTRRKYRFNCVAQFLRKLEHEISAKIIFAVEQAGSSAAFDNSNEIFIIDQGFRLALRLLPYVSWSNFTGWRLCLHCMPRCNAIVVGRLNRSNDAILDFLLIPRMKLKRKTVHITDLNFSNMGFITLSNLSDIRSAVSIL